VAVEDGEQHGEAVLFEADSEAFGGETVRIINQCLNFDQKSIIEGIRYAHDRGRHVLMAINTYAQAGQVERWRRAIDTAADLGAHPVKAFFTVTLPLSKSGIIAGSMLVFIPSMGEYVIPELVGGPDNLMIGKVLWQAFSDQANCPLAAAIAVVMVLVLVVPIALEQYFTNRENAKGSK